MRTRIAAGLSLTILAAALWASLPAQASPPAQGAGVVEIDGSPLRIQVFANGSLQVFHRDYTLGAAYGNGASGAFVALGPSIYGPLVPVGPQVTEFMTLGNEGPMGRGTAGDP